MKSELEVSLTFDAEKRQEDADQFELKVALFRNSLFK